MNELARTVDPRALYFTPLGLGGPMSPNVAQRVFARERDLLDLPVVVPAKVRDHFAKAVRMYTDGLFTYDNFTSASREAHRVLEVALKVRFLEHYASGVPLLTNGVERLMQARTFEDVRRRVRDGKTALKRYPRFDGSLAALMYWARCEGFFYGQRNRIREWATRNIRNDEMHSEFDSVYMPPTTWQSLRLVSEMIARLWGAEMATRSVYPGTIDRFPMAVGKGPQHLEGTQFALELLPHMSHDDAPIWYVVLGAPEENLIWWSPEVEATGTPVTHLWGPGSWDELHEAVRVYGASWQPDDVMVLDRRFYIRVQDGALDRARTAKQLLALQGTTSGERWFCVIADGPGDARGHVQRVLAGSCRPRGCRCPVTSLFERARRQTAVRHAKNEPKN